MAKALLLLQATEGQVDALQAALSSALDAVVGTVDDTTAQLMVAAEPDFFYVPQAPHQRPDLVLELVTAPGKPLASVYPKLSELLLDQPVSKASEVFVMQTRNYIQAPAQPYHYHYLMLKKPGFSTADYVDYYSKFHCRMGFNTPGIAGYWQNYIDPEASATLAQLLDLTTRDVTSISELSMQSTEDFVSDPATMAVAEPAAQDEERFVDRTQSVAFTSRVIARCGNFERIEQAVFPQHFADKPALD